MSEAVQTFHLRPAFKLVSFALVVFFVVWPPFSSNAFAGDSGLAPGQASDSKYTYYVHGDNLGSAHLLTEGQSAGGKHVGIFYNQGDLIQRIEYNPYGQETYVLNPNLSFDPSFTGQTYDIESGLYYFNARYYNPQLGRFIQADTVVPSATDFQSYNRYAYARNNPLKYVDPSGHSFLKDLIGAFLGALIGALIFAVVLSSFFAGGVPLLVMIAQASVGQLMFAGAVAGLVGGAIAGGISAGIKGAFMGAVFGFLGGGLGAGASFYVGPAVMISAGAALSYATEGWKGLACFGAGLLGAVAGGAIANKAFAGANKVTNNGTGGSNSSISREEFQQHINEIKDMDITDSKLAARRDKVVTRLQKNLDNGKLISDPNLEPTNAGRTNLFTKKISINPDPGLHDQLTYTLAHEGAHAAFPFMGHLKVYQFEWDLANVTGYGINLYGGVRPTQEWFQNH